jgi:hypothetical protein
MDRKQRHVHRPCMLAWLLCFLAIAGDGTVAAAASSDPPIVKLADEYQEIMQDILRVLGEVQSEETARDALHELSRLQKKLAGHNRRAAVIDKSDKAYQKLSDDQKKRIDNAVRIGFKMWKETTRLMKDRAIFRQIGDRLLAIRGDIEKVPTFSKRALAGRVEGQPREFTSGRFTVNADGSYDFALFSGRVADVCDTSALRELQSVQFKQDSIVNGLSAADLVLFAHSKRQCVAGVGKLFLDTVDNNMVTGKLYALCGEDNVVNGTFVAIRCD